MLIHTQIQTHVLTYLQTCKYMLKYKHKQIDIRPYIGTLCALTCTKGPVHASIQT